MKYIGPFLRINKLKKQNIKNQLFYLAKESLNQILLYSKCGVYTSFEELKIKNISSSDINTFKDLSPLLCIYRKANPKLVSTDNKLSWNPDKFKTEINIDSTSLMTLCILELYNFYDNFKNIDTTKHSLSKIYRSICKTQLEFYATHLRNDEGVFVDKIVENSLYDEELKFEEKNKKFNFSSQALMMAAFCKCSTLLEEEDRENYLNFSLDILNMLIQFKESLYELPSDELIKLCLALNIFYECSHNEECRLLLLDLCELLSEDLSYSEPSLPIENLELTCMKYINYMLFYRNTGIIKFKEKADIIFGRLVSLYDSEKGIFLKTTEDKDVSFSCSEIMLYLLVCLVNPEEEDNKVESISIDIFKHQVLDSGIILSWPEAPDLNDVERYEKFSLKPEDLIEEQNFRMASIATPESCEVAPVFGKNVVYNKKKEEFKNVKVSFDAYKNMLIFLYIIQFSKPFYNISKDIKKENDCKD